MKATSIFEHGHKINRQEIATSGQTFMKPGESAGADGTAGALLAAVVGSGGAPYCAAAKVETRETANAVVKIMVVDKRW